LIVANEVDFKKLSYEKRGQFKELDRLGFFELYRPHLKVKEAMLYLAPESELDIEEIIKFYRWLLALRMAIIKSYPLKKGYIIANSFSLRNDLILHCSQKIVRVMRNRLLKFEGLRLQLDYGTGSFPRYIAYLRGTAEEDFTLKLQTIPFSSKFELQSRLNSECPL